MSQVERSFSILVLLLGFLFWSSVGFGLDKDVSTSKEKIIFNELTFPHPNFKKKKIKLAGEFEVIHLESYQITPADSTVFVYFNSRLPLINSAGLYLGGSAPRTQYFKVEIETQNSSQAQSLIEKAQKSKVLDLRDCLTHKPSTLKFSYFEKYPTVLRCYFTASLF